MKVVINRCYGEFSLSNKAVKRYLELKGNKPYFYKQTMYDFIDGADLYEKVTYDNDSIYLCIFTIDKGEYFSKFNNEGFFDQNKIKRTDADLIQTIEELGAEANTIESNLRIVEIPDDVDWEISEFNGMETIEECHRSWC